MLCRMFCFSDFHIVRLQFSITGGRFTCRDSPVSRALKMYSLQVLVADPSQLCNMQLLMTACCFWHYSQQNLMLGLSKKVNAFH